MLHLFGFFLGSWLLRCLSKAPCSGFPLLTKFLPCGYTVLSSTWVCWRARPKHEKHPLFLLRETTSRQIISCPWLRNLSTLCLCSHFIRLQLISCFFFFLLFFVTAHAVRPKHTTEDLLFSNRKARDVGTVVFSKNFRCAVFLLASCYSQEACQVICRLQKRANFLISWGVIFEPLPSSFTAGCFQLNSCKLESVQWFWPSSAPEVLQKKPGPLYSNFKPYSGAARSL